MANITRAKGNIYNLAKLAKERLKQNNYIKTKTSSINNARAFSNYIANKKEETSCIKAKATQKKYSYDEELYKKVCFLIENNQVANPVSLLIDKQLFSSLDPEAKQFYIHNLTEKYKFMKSRYYKEHPISLFLWLISKAYIHFLSLIILEIV